jgi:O-antigen/teichoic acid export membrane protein
MIIICSVLLFTNITGGIFRIEWFVYAQTVAYLLTALIVMSILVAKTGRITIRFNPQFCLVFLKKSYPYALLILLMAFYNRIDTVMLERLLPDPLGKQQAGIYAQAFRLLDAVSMFGALVAGLLLPMFSSMIKKKEALGSMIQLAFVSLFIPAVIIAVSTLFYSRDIMELLYHSHIDDSVNMLGILMTGFPGIALTYVFGTLLTANGSLKQLNIMALCGMVLNVVLNLILIPVLYGKGSAIASMITQLLTATAQLWIAIYYFKIKPDLLFLVKLIVFITVVIFTAYFSRMLDNRLAGYAMTITLSTVFALIIKLISLKDMFLLLKKET